MRLALSFRDAPTRSSAFRPSADVELKFMRAIAPATFVLLLLALSAPDSRAQRCGGGFAFVSVANSAGRSIPNVTIEIVAELPVDAYKKLNEHATIKLPPKDAKEVIKRSPPLRKD